VSDFIASGRSVTGPRFGVERLDQVVHGLLWGENVVWAGSPAAALGQLARQVIMATAGVAEFGYRVLVQPPAPGSQRPAAGSLLSLDFDKVITLGPADGRQAAAAIAAIEEVSESKPHLLVAFDLCDIATGPGSPWEPGTIGALARAILRGQGVGLWFTDAGWAGGADGRQLMDLAQLVLEAGPEQIRIEKADGRPAGVVGAALRHSVGSGGELTVISSPAAARLGSGLRAIRQARGWSQGELAQVAGVSASAISQAERGQHALSLETLLDLSARLGMTVDQIIRGEPVGYQVSRAESVPDGFGEQARMLVDEPRLGLRALLVRIPPRGAAAQAAGPRGRELLLAAQGLVQVVLPTARPVIRPGDAILVTDGPIASCRNLGDDEARVFWLTLGLPGLADR
jgi:transcriptional regulator with XRE-family HTH domain